VDGKVVAGALAPEFKPASTGVAGRVMYGPKKEKQPPCE